MDKRKSTSIAIKHTLLVSPTISSSGNDVNQTPRTLGRMSAHRDGRFETAAIESQTADTLAFIRLQTTNALKDSINIQLTLPLA